MSVSILQGDALEVLKALPSDHFHCVVCSPPYWGLRDYGTGTWEGGDKECDHSSVRRGHGDEKQATSKGTSRDPIRPDCRYCGARRIDQQIGLEPTPDAWCARLVEVFREVRRCLRPDGVVFINLGDSYASNGLKQTGRNDGGRPEKTGGFRNGRWCEGEWTQTTYDIPRTRGGTTPGLKPKDLIGAPWMLAFALRADGWYLRSEIIWAKTNPMPESVTDRPTKAHEQVFLLTKSSRYFYDQEAVRESLSPTAKYGGTYRTDGKYMEEFGQSIVASGTQILPNPAGRNLRSVWTIATDPLPSIDVDGEKLDHFASYPVELARRCILAGTSAKGCCPACGAPWARVVEREPNPMGINGGEHREVRRDGALGKRERDPEREARIGQVLTAGWRAMCSCPPAEPQPCRVLDPFFGSGRTGLACEELGRDCVGIELNPASVRMAHAQLERAKARRMIGDVTDRVPVLAGQMKLEL